jgi:3-oxoacyl-[acyl-carrier protein] reductase
MTIEGAPEGYAESKIALNEYFKESSRKLAHLGIRFNIISPGNVYFAGSRWEKIKTDSPEFVRDLLDIQVPLRSFISPQEITEAIVYLSSESAKNITGANLVIDGGQST